MELIIHAELGIVSAGKAPKEGDENYDPYHVVDAGGSPASVAYGGGFIDSASNFGLILSLIHICFEENIYLGKGQKAASNGELVAKVVRIAKERCV